MTFPERPLLGVILAGAVGGAGLSARALTWSGASAAAIVGTVAVAAGWNWGALLLAYFVATTLVSRIGADRKRARTADVIDKAGARDATQVMANGFPFLFCASMAMIRPGPFGSVWMAAGAASLAASAADTWATEIGTLAGQPPRSILSWRRLPIGASGGVTAVGWAAAIAGAAFVSAVALAAGSGTSAFPWILLGGIGGAVMDSLIGASIQRRSWCDACGLVTEMRVHTCGAATRRIGGFSWLENDAVNLIATVTGSVIPWVGVALGLYTTPKG